MKLWGLVAFLGLAAAAAWGDTEVRFVADEETAVFRITAVLVEPSGLTLNSEVTEVLKKMELLTLAPSTVTLANGDYLLNWGGTEDFNRTFTLKADGSPREVRLLGNRTAALWSLVAAGSGAAAALVTAPLAAKEASMLPWALGAAGVSLTGLIALLIASPRVEVR